MHGHKRLQGLNTRGFSFLETIIVVAVMSLIFFAMADLYRWYGKIFSLGDAQFNTVNDVRTAFLELKQYAAPAHRVLATSTINNTLYASGTTTLVLQLPTINSAGDTVDNVWDYAVFYTSSTKLYSYLQAAAASSRITGLKLLGETVSSTVFTYDSADWAQVKSVGIDIITKKQLNKNLASQQLVTSHETETIFLKNY